MNMLRVTNLALNVALQTYKNKLTTNHITHKSYRIT